jgi:hypothetical protein
MDSPTYSHSSADIVSFGLYSDFAIDSSEDANGCSGYHSDSNFYEPCHISALFQAGLGIEGLSDDAALPFFGAAPENLPLSPPEITSAVSSPVSLYSEPWDLQAGLPWLSPLSLSCEGEYPYTSSSAVSLETTPAVLQERPGILQSPHTEAPLHRMHKCPHSGCDKAFATVKRIQYATLRKRCPSNGPLKFCRHADSRQATQTLP